MNLMCPRCKQPFEEHDGDKCPKGITRRFFLGAFSAAVTGAALAKFEIATPAADSLIAVAAPKVFTGASTVITTQGGEGVTREEIMRIAARTGRSAVGIHNGDVVHFVDAVKERLLV